jgi:hypothetical protein
LPCDVKPSLCWTRPAIRHCQASCKELAAANVAVFLVCFVTTKLETRTHELKKRTTLAISS